MIIDINKTKQPSTPYRDGTFLHKEFSEDGTGAELSITLSTNTTGNDIITYYYSNPNSLKYSLVTTTDCGFITWKIDVS